MERLKQIHYDLVKLYNAEDFNEAKKYLESLLEDGANHNELRSSLTISKSFKNRPELEEALNKIIKEIEKQTGFPVL
jgi:hypothetical protein